MLDFIKMMYSAGCDIRAYVPIGTITADQYKEITGDDYQATVAASAAPTDTTSAASDSTAASGTANVTPTA